MINARVIIEQTGKTRNALKILKIVQLEFHLIIKDVLNHVKKMNISLRKMESIFLHVDLAAKLLSFNMNKMAKSIVKKAVLTI